MRLCWNDSLGGPLGNMDPEEAKYIYDIGYRVAGVNAGVHEASAADIDHAKHVLEDAGLMPGPYGIGLSAIRPDAGETRESKKKIASTLKIAGKLGCTALRYSVGSLHPTNIWQHHPENFTQKALDELVKHTRELTPIAEDAGCMLCPETTQWTIVHNLQTMKEFVDRCDSPYVRIIIDFVNHTTPERAYNTGEFIKCAVAFLGDRIGEFHVKDVMVQDALLVIHIDEAPMGTGLMDHATMMKVSNDLEPWKTFSLEHISDRNMIKKAYDHIDSVAKRIGHHWTSPRVTRPR